MKKVIKKVLQFLIPVALLWFLISSGNLKITKIKETLFAHTWVLLLPLVLYLFSIFITSIRWAMLVQAQGVRIRKTDAFKLTYVGFFYSLFFPGGVGGDLVKIVYLVRYFPQMRSSMATTVVVDRIIGLYGLFVLALFAVALNYQKIWQSEALKILALALMGAFVASTLFMGFLFSRRARKFIPFWNKLLKSRIGSSLERISTAFLMYRNRPGAVVKAITISVLNHCVLVTGFFLVGAIMGMEGQLPPFGDLFSSAEVKGSFLSIADTFLAAPLAMFSNSLPISPGGIGVGEAAFGYFWNLMGNPSGSEICLLWRVLFVVVGLPGIYFYLTMKSQLHITKLDEEIIQNMEKKPTPEPETETPSDQAADSSPSS